MQHGQEEHLSSKSRQKGVVHEAVTRHTGAANSFNGKVSHNLSNL